MGKSEFLKSAAGSAAGHATKLAGDVGKSDLANSTVGHGAKIVAVGLAAHVPGGRVPALHSVIDGSVLVGNYHKFKKDDLRTAYEEARGCYFRIRKAKSDAKKRGMLKAGVAVAMIPLDFGASAAVGAAATAASSGHSARRVDKMNEDIRNVKEAAKHVIEYAKLHPLLSLPDTSWVHEKE